LVKEKKLIRIQLLDTIGGIGGITVGEHHAEDADRNES
jgi:hypothetical protein